MCFHRWPFANSANHEGALQYLRMEPVSGINKDMSSAKLLPTTSALAYAVNCVCFCHLVHEDAALLPVFLWKV